MRSMNDATTAELATPVGRVGVREGGTVRAALEAAPEVSWV